jgi:AMMECR1 domain-containing protein
LLTNFEEIEDCLNWEPGKHGIEIEFVANGKTYRGTYLPEVASDQGWGQETSLEHLVSKAGWREGFAEVKDKMKLVRRYQSCKFSMSYEDYISSKKD